MPRRIWSELEMEGSDKGISIDCDGGIHRAVMYYIDIMCRRNK